MSNTKKTRRDAHVKLGIMRHEVSIAVNAQREGALMALFYLRKIAIYNAVTATDLDQLIDRVKASDDIPVLLLT